MLSLVHKLYYPLCFFQYYDNKSFINEVKLSLKTLVSFSNNHEQTTRLNVLNFVLKDILMPMFLRSYIYHIPITHCYWLPQSSFKARIPLDVNSHLIHYIDNSHLFLTSQKTLCYCVNETHYDCFRDELGPAYPGQTLIVPLYAHLNFTFNAEIISEIQNQTYITSCIVYQESEVIQRIGKNCSNLKYTIAFPTDSWCELFLKVPQNMTMEYNIFYIRQLKCPLGFVKLNGTCRCYPMFTMFGFTKCDINKQAILRPPNGWIHLLINNSHSYYISQQCPFSYCLPYPQFVRLSSPSSQCQFNRTGLLCGHCQQGFSTVFGSSQCKQCSNLYLLLVILFAVVGILVILLLFVLNLLLTDGTVNAYILYFDIIHTNMKLFFPNIRQLTPLYVIISFVNLELGMTVCFYDGMDDYAKIWFQLVFSFLLNPHSHLINCSKSSLYQGVQVYITEKSNNSQYIVFYCLSQKFYVRCVMFCSTIQQSLTYQAIKLHTFGQ